MLLKHENDVYINKNPIKKSNSQNISTNNISCENIVRDDCGTAFENSSTDVIQEKDFTVANFETFSRVLDSSAIKFISKCYSLYNLPRNIVQQIIDDVSLMFTNISNILEPKCLRLVNGHESSELIELQNMIWLSQNPFHKFRTEHLRFNYFQENGSLIKPISFRVGEEFTDVKCDNGVTLDIKKCSASFIPPSDILKAFMELPNVFETIIEYINSLTDSNVICNIIQTEIWKNVLKRFGNKTVLPICLYFDDFEVNNPLGTHAGVHKIGAVYYSILCLPPQYASNLDNIFVAQFHHTKDLQKFGTNFVFGHLLDNLKQLEKDGIVISINNTERQIYFVVTLILGDNLGVHKMLGFHESFNCNYFCRFCRTHKSLTTSEVVENHVHVRTIDNYNADLQNTQFGIKEKCIFNELENYHCIVNITCDIMHDIYEGICRYDIGHILSYYIFEKKLFTIALLNQKIKYFNIHNENKPPPIKKIQIQKKYITLSASEMKCFIRIFGSLVGEFVPINDLVWDLYKLLRQICEIVGQESVTPNDANLLKILIAEHNKIYIDCFGKLKPKHHFLIHYPRIMNTIGPLATISCIRFEGKHHMFKLYAKSVVSRINITHTLALKNQLHFNYRLLSNTGFQENTELGPIVSTFTLNHYVYKDDILNCYSSDTVPANIYSMSWIKKLGVHFKVGLYAAVDFKNFCPVFGVINDILSLNERDIFFIVQMYETVQFDEHIQSYIVTETSVRRCVNMMDLIVHQSFSLNVRSNGQKCFQMCL